MSQASDKQEKRVDLAVSLKPSKALHEALLDEQNRIRKQTGRRPSLAEVLDSWVSGANEVPAGTRETLAHQWGLSLKRDRVTLLKRAGK